MSRSAPYNRDDRRRTSGPMTYSLGPNPNVGSPADREGQWKHDMFHQMHGGSSVVTASGFRGPPISARPTRKLQVEDLHYEVSEQELKGLFESIGPIAQGPNIIYDKSGRSTGVAYVTYENVGDAVTARNEFNGAKAKGRVIAVDFVREVRGFGDRGPAAGRGFIDDGGYSYGGAGRGGRGARGAPRGPGGAAAGRSLADRINKPDLLSRLAPEKSNGKDKAPASASASAKQGPVRSVSGGNGGGRSRGRRGEGKKEQKTVSDLDAELEAFMKAPAPSNAEAEKNAHKAANEEAAKSIHAPRNVDGDVEMEG